MKVGNWVLMICGSVVAAGCGQKGPLYLPDKNASVVTRPAVSNNPSPPPAQQPAPDQQSQAKDKSNDDSQSSKPKN